MAKSSGPRTKVTVKTSARMSKKGPLSPEALRKLDAWWRASNYLAAGQLYLRDNPLLRTPLKPEHLKHTPVGHWGTVPGQNFIYTHLNRVITKYDLNMIYIWPRPRWFRRTGPDLSGGHLQRSLPQRKPG